MATAGWLGVYLLDNNVDTLVIDTVGLGSGVYDRLKEVGTGNTRLVSFNGGAGAKDNAKHVNAIAEGWWRMRVVHGRRGRHRRKTAPSSGRSRAASTRSSRTGASSSSRKRSLPKSPDEADASAMTFAHPAGGRT